MRNVMVIIIKDRLSNYDGIYVFHNERDAEDYFQQKAGSSAIIFIGNNIMSIEDHVCRIEGEVHWTKMF